MFGKWTIARCCLDSNFRIFVLLFLWSIRECGFGWWFKTNVQMFGKWTTARCCLDSIIIFWSFVPLVNKRVCSAGDLKQMYKCLANELLPVAVLIQSLFFGLLFLWFIWVWGQLVILNKCTIVWQMNYCRFCLCLKHYVLLFLWFIRVWIRLVILNKCTNVWQMNYCPLLYWFNHYFLVFCSFGLYECGGDW